MRLIVDLETNGFLQECSRIHCIGVRDIGSDYHELIDTQQGIIGWLNKIQKSNDELIFHNGFVFDLPVIKKLTGIDLTKTNKIHDTIILSQLFYGDLKNLDYDRFKVPKKYIGKHSLAAWGHRLLCYKGEYTGGFEVYTPDMGEYCSQDTEVTKQLFLFLEKEKPDRVERDECIELEYEVAIPLARQQAYGIKFNVEKAQQLECTLQAEKVRIRQQLQELFKPRVVSLGKFTPKVNSSKMGYKKGNTFTKIKFEEYNPSSRVQTIDRLCKELGWTPSEFTEKGNPELDEEIIESLPFKELEPLKNYLIVEKRLSQLAVGNKAWLKKVKDDGRIYGSILQCGTLTGRGAHFSPNLSQVPSNDKFYGKECRELFEASEGKVMVGVDADALEMRTLAGYLKSIDRGQFLNTLLKGKKEDKTDMHSQNARAYGVDIYENGRDCAKTAFYGSLYGCKNPKLGLILQQYGIDFRDYVPNFDEQLEGIKEWSKKKEKGFTDKYLECLIAGKTARERYGKKLPHLKSLVQKVVDKWKKTGYLLGLDGRKLRPRSEHSVFNILNQSAGAVLMKKTMIIADRKLQEVLKAGKDYEFMLWSHDEFQLEVNDNPDTIEIVKRILMEAMEEAGQYFKFPCPIIGNAQVGTDWSGTH